MRSIKARFDEVVGKNPNSSTYICFAEAVKGQCFDRETISRWFSKLVAKDDYAPSTRKALISQLVALSKKACGLPILDSKGHNSGPKKLKLIDMYWDEISTPKKR